MKTDHILITAALTALTWTVSSQLMAQSPAGKTREQVQQELAEAVRTGNVRSADEGGMLEREASPSRYPAAPSTGGKTRAQVQEELREAVRTGNMPANDESGRTMREVNPGLYPKN